MTDLLQVIMEMRDGRVAADCNGKFKEVLDAVLQTGRKGEMTIKLTAEPSRVAMGGAVVEVETRHEIKLKKPELEIGRSVFFVNKDGDLSRDEPNQEPLFEERQEVDGGKAKPQ